MRSVEIEDKILTRVIRVKVNIETDIGYTSDIFVHGIFSETDQIFNI